MTHFCVITKKDLNDTRSKLMGEIIGYIRVSTAEQNTARQEAALSEYGCQKLFIDKMSGKERYRPQLEAMLNYIREGDAVVVESISRLARSTRDLLDIVDKLKDKGVAFISLKESIDTTTPQGKFVMTIFAALSELERENIRQRQAEGIAIAKEQGKYKGRRPKKVDQTELEMLIDRWQRGEIKQSYICKKLGISRSTLSRKIKSTRK
jgi:DNA invertase Pin-like site-specific DNA recombinase